MPDTEITITSRSKRSHRAPEDPMEWVISGDSGISSRTIWAVMQGVSLEVMRPDIPYDPPDFGRCYRLLQIMPEWKGRLDEVAEKYPAWRPFVEHWEELEQMYEACLDERGRYQIGDASKALYDRMKELRDYA